MFYIMTLSSALRSETIEAKTMEVNTKDGIESSRDNDMSSSADKITTRSPMYDWPKLTDFTIENILRNDFGRTTQKHASRHRPRHLPIRRHVVDQLTVENIFRGRATFESERRKRKDSEPPISPAISPAAEQQLSSETDEGPEKKTKTTAKPPLLWPAWVYCTRYSDRPSSGPRTRKIRSHRKKDEKRPRTAFSAPQLQRLRQEFQVCNYLTEERRRSLAMELDLSESQIKIWFQNKRAKIKKAHGYKNPLAVNLMTQGLYNHSTIPLHDESSDEQ